MLNKKNITNLKIWYWEIMFTYSIETVYYMIAMILLKIGLSKSNKNFKKYFGFFEKSSLS